MSFKKILIVGARPIGLAAAVELVRRGYEPRIIDAASGPADQSRALGIHARTLEIFEPAGITETLLSRGSLVNQARFFDGELQFMHVDFSHVRQKYNHVLILAQSETECILIEHIRQQGVTVTWNTPLTSLSQENEKVLCSLGDDQQEEFDLVIGCDGARSTVRRELGIGFDGKVFSHDWYLADVRFRGERPTNEIRVKLDRAAALVFFPLKPNVGRFVYTNAGIRERLESELDVEEYLWESDFRVSHRIVDSYQQGSVFLAGDAAHIHSPVGGRGMNLGIEDAATLAYLIDIGETGKYTDVRKPLGKAVLRQTFQQTKLITSDGGFLRFVLRRIAPIVMKSKTAQRLAFRRLSGADTPRPKWLYEAPRN